MTNHHHAASAMFKLLLVSASVLCALTAPGAAQAQSTPQIILIPSAGSPPPPPAGMKVTCLVGPDSLQWSATCPVIQYQGLYTWAFSFLDNRDSYGVVSYDGQANLIKNTTRDGARYVYKMTVDPAAQTVSIWGQGNAKVDVAWADLPTPPTPQIATLPAQSAPPPPPGLKTFCATGPGSQESTTCPVIQYHGYTTWIYSFLDNRSAYGVVSYDAQGHVVKNTTRDGARYIYKITSDPTAQTLSLWGQADAKVVMAWTDLP
ncbi:MAG: hypothetical protein JWP92_2362 [Caulobacter sp.]|nr:hypothetical protein [Caulobacter sp.]